jgi:hypothetical protein
MSTDPPAAHPMIILIGLAGYGCAQVLETYMKIMQQRKEKRIAHLVRRYLFMIVTSIRCGKSPKKLPIPPAMEIKHPSCRV